jgi:hypothetical protein
MLPIKKPVAAGTHVRFPHSTDISSAGARSDQKLAAIITPAAKPRDILSSFLSTFCAINTVEAPIAVINHVNDVAIRAKITGLKFYIFTIMPSRP